MVSTPVSWSEVEVVAAGGPPGALRFTQHQVLERVERHGDLLNALPAGSLEGSTAGSQ